MSQKEKISRSCFKHCLILVLFFLYFIPAYAQDSLKVKGHFFRQNFSVTHAIIKSSYRISKIFNKQSIERRQNKIVSKGYHIVFEDNFDSLNKNIWRVGQPWGDYNPGALHQYYGKDGEVSVHHGKLYLINRYKPKTFAYEDTATVNIPFAVGLINSDISFTPKYGYFEISAKMPQGSATWPAFWLTGKTRWPPEIDIFENYGGSNGKDIHRQTQSVHYGISGRSTRGFISRGAKVNKQNDTLFHIYACEWTPNFVKFYTDGKLIRYQRINRKLKAWLNEEMTIIINNGLEAKYLPIDYYSYPTNHLVVDWIRVWQKESIRKRKV